MKLKNVFILFVLIMIQGFAYADSDWIMTIAGKKITPEIAEKISDIVYVESFKAEVDPILVFQIIKRESRFDPKARNKSSNASGLMQVIPKYHKDKIGKRNILDIETNIQVGIQILKHYLNRFKGNKQKALNAYAGVVINEKNYYKKVNSIKFPERQNFAFNEN